MTSTPTFRWTRSAAAIAASALLVLSACSGSDDGADDSLSGVEVDVSDDPDFSGETVDEEVNPGVDETDTLVETAPVAITGDALPGYVDPDQGGPQIDPAVGTPSPVLSGVSFDGTSVTVGGPTDRPTFVVFLAHWCPHCNDELPELVGLADAGDFPEGLDVVAVSTAVAEDRDNFPPSDWLEAGGWPFPVMVDSAESSALAAVGAGSFPFAVVLDTDGTVLARKAGQSTGDVTVDFLESALATSAA